MNAVTEEFTASHVDAVIGKLAFTLQAIRSQLNKSENDLHMADTMAKAKKELDRVIKISAQLTEVLDETELDLTSIQEQFDDRSESDNG